MYEESSASPVIEFGDKQTPVMNQELPKNIHSNHENVSNQMHLNEGGDASKEDLFEMGQSRAIKKNTIFMNNSDYQDGDSNTKSTLIEGGPSKDARKGMSRCIKVQPIQFAN